MIDYITERDILSVVYHNGTCRDGEQIEDYEWEVDPAFPLYRFDFFRARHEMEEWFEQEQENRTFDGDYTPSRIGERYYDSYWGWWNDPGIINILNLPILVEIEGEHGVQPWDGWHRTVIAKLAGLQTIPAIVGKLKKKSEI